MICKKHNFEVILREWGTSKEYARCRSCDHSVLWADYHVDIMNDRMVLAGSVEENNTQNLIW